jgi:subtilase family protein/GEVED domain-containing protein/type IX secretion system substrate protein
MKIIDKISLGVILLFCLINSISAQRLDHVQGDILIRPAIGVEIETIVSQFQYFQRESTQLKAVEQISKPLNIWLLHFDHTTINEIRFLEHLNNRQSIEVAQFNHLTRMRATTPDDALFLDQWQYINDGSNGGTVDADIDADLAWDITTGGVTPLGDTIVVAVLDNGIDLNHQDFGNNLWTNYAEIPNNGMDDDNNGYVDDYRGWSTVSNSDNIVSNSGGHGTSVAGIIGAKGNNVIGVTGVNWNVKTMIIRNDFNANEAAVLAAYSYALDARIRYNNSNGTEGAFVVATNASWGVDMGDPDDAPLWCAFYDEMGEAGIISCGATINGNVDVDVEGDLPTACPSEYLISVTNTNRMDNKVTGAGYGVTTIDLGAPGAQVFTTTTGNSYDNFGGTSGATPHVAGAIALLYAAPCDNLTILAKLDPPAAAAQAKQYILDGVDPNNSLQGITTSGGRLNLNNSLETLMNNCSACPEAYDFEALDLTDVSANLSWSTGINALSSNLRWRQVGAPVWNEIIDATSPYPISNLTECTEYEFQIDAICDNETSGYSESFIFTTDGCCLPPTGVNVVSIEPDSVLITWNSVLAAESYNLLYASSGDGGFIPGITTNSLSLGELDLCSTYTILIQTVCANQTTGYSIPFVFSTLGCGACTDLTYCESISTEAEFEWIEEIQVGDFINTSGSDDGYGNFTDTTAEFMTFNSYNVLLTPGFDGNAFEEYFKIWIDFNFDGEFDPVSELAFDAGSGSTSPTTGEIFIPGTTPLGVTRMRISMQWIGPSDTDEPEACEVFQYGEVEDYCITIIEGTTPSCDQPTDLDTLEVFENTALLTWEDFTDDHLDHNLRIKKTTVSNWTVYSNIDPPFSVIDLDNCSTYEFQVEANCLDNTSSTYTMSYLFDTKCLNNVETPLTIDSPKIYPNPFGLSFSIELNLAQAGTTNIQLFDTKGQLVYKKEFDTFSNKQILEINDLQALSDGVYFLHISTPDSSHHQKLMKF